MKKVVDLDFGIASILNIYEIKGLLNLIIPIADLSRGNKHGLGVGKTIRRRDTNKEVHYGICKKYIKKLEEAKLERNFFKHEIKLEDNYLKKISIDYINDMISFIKKENVNAFKIKVVKEIEEKLAKELLKLSIK